MMFDLHIHSRKSPDSLSTINNIIRYAKKRSLQGIAITDHGSSVTEDLGAIAERNQIWIITGSEIHTEIGDIIALFMTKPVRNTKAEDVIDEIHDQGGIAVLAHPFKYNQEYPNAFLEKFDAVELINARWKDLSRFADRPHVNRVLSAIAGRTAGSDAHFSFEVGRAVWVTPALASPLELKKNICANAGRAQATAYSEWLDELSQGIKFLRNPSVRQLARFVYRSARHALPWRNRFPHETE